MSLKIFLTSPMAIEVGDVVVDAAAIGSRQVRLALAFLVCHRRQAVPRTQLADVLWPESLPHSWEGALRGVVSKVRAALAAAGLSSPELLTSAFGCYQLHLPPDTVVDVEAAAAALAAAEAALAQGDAEEACERVLVARRLAARPFLPDEEGEWVEHQRGELRSLLLRSLEAAADAHLARGEPKRAAETAEAAIAAEPFREAAYRRLMAAHAAAGSRGEALRAYERCRAVLAEELGVRPAAETEAAYLQLLGEEPEPGTGAPGRSRLKPPQRPTGPRRRLVDRATEVKALAQAFDQARGGRRQMVVVEGEAGMGKTSLVVGFAAEAAEEGAAVLYGRCDREMWTPYQPFVEALGAYVDATPAEDLRAQLGWGAPELSRLLPQLGARLPQVAAGGTLDPETERHRLFMAVASFISAVTAAAPIVLVVDDCQWAGPAAVLLLRHLVRALAEAPVLVVVACRPEEVGAANPALAAALADLGREEGVKRLHLGGLDEAAVTELVHHMVGAEPATSARDLARRLRAHTGGNPFFLSELIDQLRQEQTTNDVDSLLAAASEPDLVVPARVRELIELRRGRLSHSANHLLEAAAVIGAEFALEVLEGAGAGEGEVLFDALEEVRAAGLVCEVPGTVGHYRFAEGLVADAVRDGLGATRRARLHARVAEALECQSAAERSPGAIAEVAHHLFGAGPFAPAAKVLDATLAAAESAGPLGYEQACAFYERALGLGLDQPGAEGQRCSVLVALAGVSRKAGRVTAARASYLEAVAVARHLGDPVSLAESVLGLGAAGRGESEWITDEVRIGLLEESLGGLGADHAELRARVLAELAKALYVSNEHECRDRVATEAALTAKRTAPRPWPPR